MAQTLFDEPPVVGPTLEVPLLPSARGRWSPFELAGWPVPSSSDGPFTYAETLLLFDWDDTILPTSWIISEGLVVDDDDRSLTTFQEAQLGRVQQSAEQALRMAVTLGRVVLVTNAEQGWIEMSCDRWLHGLVPLIAPVLRVSARTAHETTDCQSPAEWKLRAFENELARAFPLGSTAWRRNILSFGDSCQEREALLRSTTALRDCRCKTVKFEEQPSLETLNRQQLLLAASLRQIVEHDGNLDLRLQTTASTEPTLERLAPEVDEGVDRMVTVIAT